jgi:hypothetical protein
VVLTAFISTSSIPFAIQSPLCDKMGPINPLSLLIVLVYVQSTTCSFFESILGFSTIGDHFGYPAFANATYDYVVVGGGTAGLAIASRLALSGVGTVAVIEAGGFYEMDNGNLSSVPGTAAYFLGTAPLEKNPLIDWEYQTQTDAVSITSPVSKQTMIFQFPRLTKCCD